MSNDSPNTINININKILACIKYNVDPYFYYYFVNNNMGYNDEKKSKKELQGSFIKLLVGLREKGITRRTLLLKMI